MTANIIQFNYKDHWQKIKIVLNKVCNEFSFNFSLSISLICYSKTNSNDESLGFSIAGGIDKPYINYHFKSIIVIRIAENGLAKKDERLRQVDLYFVLNLF